MREILFGKEKRRTRKGITPSDQKTYILSSGSRCMQCRKKFDPLALHVHHIKPLSKGGSNRPTNLTVLCSACHTKVHKGLIRKDELKPLVKPRKRSKTRRKTKRKKRKAVPSLEELIFG